MAAAGWYSDRSLRSQLRSDYARFDFYQLVRLLVHDRSTTAGIAALDRGVRFRADLALAFPAHEVTEVADVDSRHVAVMTPNYGVAGYLGPLPEAFAEWVRERKSEGDTAMADFLDLFNHRINALRYRVKARFYPALARQYPEQSPQTYRLGAVMGMAQAGLTKQLPLPRRAQVALAGLLANQRRTPAVIERVLSNYLSASVKVSQFHGAWQTIPEGDRAQLGIRNSGLGKNAVLGSKTWDQAARVEVRIGPVDYARYDALLPDGEQHGALVALLRFLTDRQVDCRVLLLLNGESPPSELGRRGGMPRLSRNAWLPRRTEHSRVASFLVSAYDDVTETDHAA